MDSQLFGSADGKPIGRVHHDTLQVAARFLFSPDGLGVVPEMVCRHSVPQAKPATP